MSRFQNKARVDQDHADRSLMGDTSRAIPQRWLRASLAATGATMLLLAGGMVTSVSAQSERGDGRVTRSTPETRSAPVQRSAPTTRGGSSYGGGRRSGSVGGSGSGRHVGDGSRYKRRGDSRYGRRGKNKYRRGYSYGSYYRSPYYYFGFGYPFSWWLSSHYGPWGYGPYGDRYGYGYHNGGRYYRGDAVALDLDISPEEAEIYVDGKLVGIADQYDGFPRYLWLKSGTHNLVIYHKGYETLAKRITLDPGDSIRLKDKMVPGVAKSPDEMYAQLNPAPESTTRDTGRTRLAPWRYEDEEGQAAAVAKRRPRSDEAARERSPRSREAWRERRAASRTADGSNIDLRSAPAKLIFEIEPSDAAIYVDGKLVGSAADLADLGEPVLLDAGDHVVEVSRPGYEGQRTEFSVKSGESKTISLDLERE